MIDKEVRALLPVWTLCALAIVASRWQVEPFKYLGVPAYFIGTAGLGAWMMGHEYSYGTLPSLLTIPIPRRRVWTAKLAVVAPMLTLLTALGMFFVRPDRGDQEFGVALFVLPAIASLFVAPWLTMLTRSPLAAAVFTFGMLGGSLALGEWIGEWRYGFTTEVDVFRAAFLWWTLGGLSAVGAVMGWRTFASLEAVEGRGVEINFPSARPQSQAAVVTRRTALLALIAKELRLQWLAIAIAALWVVGYEIAAVWVRRIGPPHTVDSPLGVLTIMTAFYSLVLPAVIGSLACAEERQFGTLEAQLLLPVRSSTQWIVKASTALGLAVALALLLPIALERLFGGVVLNPVLGPTNRLTTESVFIALGVTSISLYVSTLVRGGLRAFVGSIAAILVFVLLVRSALELELGRKVFLMVHAARTGHTHPELSTFGGVYFVGPFAAFVVLTIMLALALPHYRYAARRPALVAMHAAIVLGCVLAYDVVMNAIMALRF